MQYNTNLPSESNGCVQTNDLNRLLPLVTPPCAPVGCPIITFSFVFESINVELFGSTAIKNSSLTTAKQSLMIAIHGSIVFEELVGNRSSFFGLSPEI